MAGSEAEDSQREVKDLRARVEAIEERLAWHLNQTPYVTYLRLRYMRRRVWRAFNADRLLRRSKAAERLAPRLLAHLNEPIDMDAHLLNQLLLETWEEAFKERKRPSSMEWRRQRLAAAVGVDSADAQQVLDDDLDALAEEFRAAKKWSDVELREWPLDEL